MGLLELVRNDKEMRRLFGQQELKIIEKQLMGVELSPSEKTRISRDIRSKFSIIRRIAPFEKEFSIKKAQEIKFLIDEAKEVILKSKFSSNIKNIFVFGSYVEKNMRLNSDIDLAIEFNKITPKEASRFRLEIQPMLNNKMQISVLNTLPDKIKREVLNKGRLIYKYGNNR